MISRNIITDVLFIVILVVLQIFLLNRIILFGKYSPVVFPVYVMFYPFYRNKFQFLGMSFLLGLGIDMFLGTWGINAFIAFIRTLLFRTSTESELDVFSFQSLQWHQFLGFIFLNLLIHQFLAQSIEYFKFSRILDMLLNVLITTAISFVFILFYVLMFKIKQKV